MIDRIIKNDLFKSAILWLIGGCIYVLLEVMWRGYSHWTMFILGGVCFVSIGLINEIIEWDMSILLQMLIGCYIITALEFTTGCIVNIGLNWNVWDYSDYPLNFLGQISLRSSILWYFISSVGIILDDYLRYWLFKEEKPHYKII